MAKTESGRAVHPISVVAERTGLSPDVLRVWERRYAVVTPERDEAGRRLYSDADIERLRLLSQATSSGRSIGQLLELDAAELAALVRADEAARWQQPPRPAPDAGESGYVERAFACARRFDAAGLEAELARGAARVGAGRFIEGIVVPLFRRIGDAWHAGEVGIAQEHMATAVAHVVLDRVRTSLPVAADAPVLVVATPAGERHEIGALLAASAAAREGWRVTSLGADLPAREIATAALDAGARAVALSSIYPTDRAALAGELRTLRAALPARVALYVGGPGMTRLNGDGAIPGVTVLEDIGMLRQRLAS